MRPQHVRCCPDVAVQSALPHRQTPAMSTLPVTPSILHTPHLPVTVGHVIRHTPQYKRSGHNTGALMSQYSQLYHTVRLQWCQHFQRLLQWHTNIRRHFTSELASGLLHQTHITVASHHTSTAALMSQCSQLYHTFRLQRCRHFQWLLQWHTPHSPMLWP